jgi:hypothetical protein
VRKPVSGSTTACLVAGLLLTTAVGSAGQADQKANTRGREFSVKGCVTAAPDGRSFVLTTTDPGPLASALGRVTEEVKQTFTYELVGNVAAVRSLAGKSAVVKGRLDEDVKKDVEVDRERESAPRNAPGSQAVVKTEEKAEIEVRRLHVLSATAGTASCAG